MVVAAAVRYYTPPLPLLLLLLSALSRCFTVGIESLRALLLLLLLNAHKSFSNRGKKRGREVCVTETDRSVRRVFPLHVFLSFFSSLLFFFFFFFLSSFSPSFVIFFSYSRTGVRVCRPLNVISHSTSNHSPSRTLTQRLLIARLVLATLFSLPTSIFFGVR
jgi:hypothetical protein